MVSYIIASVRAYDVNGVLILVVMEDGLVRFPDSVELTTRQMS